MTHLFESEPYLTQALNEHHDLHQAVVDLDAFLQSQDADQVDARTVQLAHERLRALRNKIDRHFAQEEEGGYLDEAVSRVPSLARQAETLQAQHGELLQLINRILGHAQGTASCPESWSTMRLEFTPFKKKLLAHEAAENAVLGRAFNVALDAD